MMKWRYVILIVALLAIGYVSVSLFTNVGRPVKTHFDPVMP